MYVYTCMHRHGHTHTHTNKYLAGIHFWVSTIHLSTLFAFSPEYNFPVAFLSQMVIILSTCRQAEKSRSLNS